MKSTTTIALNSTLEAFCYGETIGVFVGDSAITFRGRDSLEFFQKLKTAFELPLNESELVSLDPIIRQRLPDLIKSGILVKYKQNKDTRVEFYGDGRVMSILQRLLSNYMLPLKCEKPLLVCIPDHKGLSIQQEALQRLKPGQSLLAGISRGTTFFIAPLADDSSINIREQFLCLLSTEPGIGNLYFAEELSQNFCSRDSKSAPDAYAAEWVATNLFSQIKNAALSNDVAHIYRGSLVIRDDVLMQPSPPIEIKLSDSSEEKAEILLKRFVGKGKIISQFREQFIGNSDHPLFMVNAEIARPRSRFLVECESHDSWGMGESRSAARISAFMEAIERYSSSAYSLDDYPLCKRAEIGKPVLEHSMLTGYGMCDHLIGESSADQSRRWHFVTDMSDGVVHAAPLELIRYPVGSDEAQYDVFDMVTSSGVAAHLSLEDAIKGACHELIERDAFMIAWLRKASPPLIDISSLPERAQKEVAFLNNNGWDVKLVDLTTDLAPVICALVSRNTTFYRYSIGAASNDDQETACIKALREAQSSFHLSLKHPRPSQEVLEALQSPSDHMELYASGDYDNLLLDIFSSPKRKMFSDIKQFSGGVVERIQSMGMKVFMADLSVVGVRAITPSIHVVRIIIPGLVPIHFGCDWSRTGSPRIGSIPEHLGWETKAKTPSEYQKFPHPFP